MCWVIRRPLVSRLRWRGGWDPALHDTTHAQPQEAQRAALGKRLLGPKSGKTGPRTWGDLRPGFPD